ncbi:PREDICTED: dnaJ homolog subfamily C member 3 [Ceratosolen solmsi marchali]|uniref:DnaJ homolog subfamily C member 3 n=1 Tax=Ceratosolen solmsi marchali TaxID=326594 RepID=A0AAJ6YU29_9HYME|nr:PREDICTED: dnaJ homolog subfamily C member 3 [Ceratosolen solmsi marchali]
MYRCGLLLVLLNFSHDVTASTSKGLDKLLELGTDFLSSGRYQDALSSFHEAVEGDPNNYLTYYKRGTVYLALGKAKQALSDFDRVLDLKPDFTVARIQRGQVHLKHGELELAEDDFTNALVVYPDHEDASNGIHRLRLAREQINSAKELYRSGDYELTISLLTQVIEICSWSADLRKLRAKCRIQTKDYAGAVSDIRSTTKLTADNTEGYYELANILYQLGQVQDSLKEIRECLKLDPEHSKCFPFYKKVKKLAKFMEDAEAAVESNDLQTCIEKSNRILKQELSIDNVRITALRLLCKCHTASSDQELAIKNCQAVLEIQRDPETLCDSAEAYLASDMFDDAIQDYKDALEIDAQFQRAKQGLQKAQQRQKVSEARDYYKILNVPRTAKKQQIIKAYRKAAQKWHPDNFPDEDEKKRAQKMFIDIAAAKEVLTDDEKRAKFDRGEDPLDPESGKQGHGFNPFHEFHHFQGSPFQFKFHFN